MGSEPSKELLDKRFIMIAILKFKYELELAHNSFKLNNKLNSEKALFENIKIDLIYLNVLYIK